MTTTIESVAAVGGGWRHGRNARRLTERAATLALDRAGLTASDIDLLINVGIYHKRNLGEPALAALIQEDIGANPEDPHDGGHGTFSFDVANGSCGMLTGLHVADGFLRAGTVRHAIVVAGDADPGHRMAPGFPFAPAGAAIVCASRPGDEGLVDVRLANREAADAGSDASGTGLRATVAWRDGRNRLAIEEAPGFGADAADLAAEVASQLLADHGLAAGDVDRVVANPLTEEFLDALAKGLDVPPERVVRRTDHRPGGHTAGLGVALDIAARGNGLAGSTVLLVSAGAGLTAGAALLRH